MSLLRSVCEKVERALIAVDEAFALALAKADAVADVDDKAFEYCSKVKPYFDKIRAEIDGLELLVPDASWPLPKYREMLFLM